MFWKFLRKLELFCGNVTPREREDEANEAQTQDEHG
jgi:hypothetical protein